jgi:hypothetical protein
MTPAICVIFTTAAACAGSFHLQWNWNQHPTTFSLLLLLLLPLQGTDTMRLTGSFMSGSQNLPSCTSRLAFPLGDGQTQIATLSWVKLLGGLCPTAQGRVLPPVRGFGIDGVTLSTPSGLRIGLTCAGAAAGGSCSAFVRLRVQFRANVLARSINVLEKALRRIETNNEWRVVRRSWVDTAGVCGVS